MHEPRNSLSRRRAQLLMLTLFLVAGHAFADGSGWFTADQANAGRWAYEQRCATCHGVDLEGAGAPALKGSGFNAQWNGKTLQELYSYVHSEMPLGAAGSLKGRTTRTSLLTSCRAAACRQAPKADDALAHEPSDGAFGRTERRGSWKLVRLTAPVEHWRADRQRQFADDSTVPRKGSSTLRTTPRTTG